MASLPHSHSTGSTTLQHLVSAFLSQPGLPFANVLSAEQIQRIFSQHHCDFAPDRIYSTAVVLWAFLQQVLSDGKQASCQSAVANIVAHLHLLGAEAPTEDTGDYCRARAKLSQEALRDLTTEVAEQLEPQADPSWLWQGLHVKLVDGFTFTMPDTPANREAYPPPKTQKPGVGLPIARAAVILSLATACATAMALGPYSGKQTGETALLRQLLDSFSAGELVVMDRYYCSYLMIALLLGRGVQVCTRIHQKRRADFRRGCRLGPCDHVVVWTKPEQRPDWMDEATYQALPETIELRELRYQVVRPGYRTKSFTIVTTLTDASVYSKEAIAELYGFRWNVELDIRSIKETLNLAHVRCKSPAMVRKELWTTLLGYNLIRSTAAAAALLHKKQPRQLSFTATCQYVLAGWQTVSSGLLCGEGLLAYCRVQLEQIAGCEVANRPGRIEPRVIKRRRHRYKLMQEPREVLRKKLRTA